MKTLIQNCFLKTTLFLLVKKTQSLKLYTIPFGLLRQKIAYLE